MKKTLDGAPLLVAATACLVGGCWLMPRLELAVPVLAVAFLVALWAVRGPGRGSLLLAVVVLGAAGRLPVVLTDPATSDDLYRYLWEGAVVVAGENPARWSPASPHLAHLRDETIHPRINHPRIATIYPPLAQGMFAVAAWLGAAPSIWKLFLLFFEAAAALLLGRWCLERNTPLVPVVLWLWNPALVVESGDGGHLDGAGAAWLLLALVMLSPTPAVTVRAGLGSVLLWGSVLVKPLAVPLLALTIRNRTAFAGAVIGGAAALLATLPFAREAHADLQVPLPASARIQRWDEATRSPTAVDLASERVVRSDGRAALVLVADSPEGPHRWDVLYAEPEDAKTGGFPAGSAEDLIGRYAVVVPVPAAAPEVVSLDFDAHKTVRRGIVHPGPFDRGDPRAGATDAFAYYRDDDGSFVVWNEDSGAKMARLRLAEDRMTLSGTALPIDTPRNHLLPRWASDPSSASTLPQPIVGLKISESPLMGLTQFGGRWSGTNLLHDGLEEVLGSRVAVRLLGAVGALLIVALSLWRRLPLPLAALLIAAWTVALLPVIHPWYLLWLLPGAVFLQNRTSAAIALAVALAPLLHVV